MRASVIIPSYNAKERLRLNLLALNGQSFVGNDVEIIVVDNGSNDNTEQMLKGIKMKYPCKIIRINENAGIASGRNAGILAATGDLLIFHDSDMIAERDFIAKHILAHTDKNMIVCGNFWRRIYSHYYDGFSQEQKQLCKRQAGDKQQIISDKQIISGEFLDHAFDLDIDFVKNLKKVASEKNDKIESCAMPWRFFITNNLSVERRRVIDVGMFDAGIVKYGYEDYDLGIRLSKSGSKFALDRNIISVHQEHPSNFNYKDLAQNLNYMCEKFNNIYFIDVILVCLGECLELSEGRMVAIAGEVDSLLSLGGYDNIAQLFLHLLQIVRKMCFGQGFENAAQSYQSIARDMPKLIRQCKGLKGEGGARHLVDELCRLLKKIFDIDLKTLIEM